MQNGKLGNEQRKALEKLIQNTFTRKIQKHRNAYDDAVAKATKEVKDELGITAIDEELKTLKTRITELEAEKERLGISKYNDVFILGSKTKETVDERTDRDKQAIKELESQMDRTISAIWTATELSEIKGMVDDILN